MLFSGLYDIIGKKWGDKMSDTILFHQKGVDYYYKTWHTIGDFMIIYMHSDGGGIVCSEKVYPIKKGGLCFVGAKKYHYTMPDDPDGYERSKVFVSANEFRKISAFFPNETNWSKMFTSESLVYAEIDEGDEDKVEAIFKEIEQNKTDTDRFPIVLASCYMRLLSFIEKNAKDSALGSQDFISRAIEYINRNITEDITIDGICSAVHTSKYYFCRQFKKATGLTVANYILKTRIVMAKNMLLSESMTVGEVSEKCGFSSISYFCRVFKEDVGVSPKQYKTQMKS